MAKEFETLKLNFQFKSKAMFRHFRVELLLKSSAAKSSGPRQRNER